MFNYNCWFQPPIENSSIKPLILTRSGVYQISLSHLNRYSDLSAGDSSQILYHFIEPECMQQQLYKLEFMDYLNAIHTQMNSVLVTFLLIKLQIATCSQIGMKKKTWCAISILVLICWFLFCSLVSCIEFAYVYFLLA